MGPSDVPCVVLPTTEKEADTIRQLLDVGAVTSRAALLITLLDSDTGAYRVGPLATRLGLGVSSVSMLGVTLVKLGLVDRCVPATDLRKATFALTTAGYTLARRQLALLRAFGEC